MGKFAAIISLVIKVEESILFPKFENAKRSETFDITNQPAPVVLGRVEATETIAGAIRYKVVYGNQNNFIKVDELTGTVTMLRKPSPCIGIQ